MSRMFTLVTRTAHSPETLFDVSLDIDAHIRSMAASGEQAVAGVTSGTIGAGESVTWRARHFGIWFTMTSRVSEVDRPSRFVDGQVSGPFRQFHHEHRFESDGAGCVMTDTITVASPLWGFVVEPLVLVPYLKRLIAQRNESLLAVLERRAGAAASEHG